MNKAFIFDMDGVLIDDEAIWEDEKQILYDKLFGKKVHEKLGSTIGITMDVIYERAVAAGATVEKKTLMDAFHELGGTIYRRAPIPDGTTELSEKLIELGYRIGIVSGSPMSWITIVTGRLSFEDNIEVIISLIDRDDLKHKPKPDGYLEAMRALGASPASTIILEDSNAGIAAAKASGAYTIGLKQNLVGDYAQQGADAYAETMRDVIELVTKKSAR